MRTYILLIVAIFFTNYIHANNDDEKLICGKIMDYITNDFIEDTLSVHLLSQDSTIVSTGFVYNTPAHQHGHKRESFFEIPVNNPGKYIIYIESSKNYYALYKTINIKFHRRERTIRTEPLLLKHKSYVDYTIDLKEVVVKATKVKFYFNNDTLIYNADAFATIPGFVLNDILKKMPGLEMHPNGEIKVHGRKIDELLLNGKDFFNSDRKTLLENIPAYMVKYVKIYTKEKDSLSLIKREREFSGYVMDVKLKREYNSALVANADVSYGTDNRYFLKAFGMRLNPVSRFSTSINLNNINKEEYSDGNGGYRSVDASDGKIKNSKWVMAYNFDQIRGVYSLNGNALISYQDSYIANKTFRRMFYQTGDIFGRDDNNNHTYYFKTSSDNDWNLFGNSAFDFTIQPHIMYERRKMNIFEQSSSFRENLSNVLGEDWLDSLQTDENRNLLNLYGLNSNWKETINEATSIKTWVDLQKDINIAHTEDVIHLNAGYSFHKLSTNNNSSNFIKYYQTSTSETLNQFEKNNIKTIEGKIHADYTYVLNNHSLQFGYNFNRATINNENPIYAFHKIDYEANLNGNVLPSHEKALMELDKNNSHSYNQAENNQTANLKYTYSLEKGSKYTMFSVNIPFAYNRKHLTFYRDYERNQIERNGVLPNLILNFQKRYSEFGKGARLCTFDYEYKVDFPPLYNMIDFRNTSNPLLVVKGNANLRNIRTHNFFGQFFWQNSYGNIHRMNFTLVIIDNQVANIRYFNKSTGVTEISPMNIDGNSTFNINFVNNVFFKKGRASQFIHDIRFTMNKCSDYESTESLENTNISSVSNYFISENIGADLHSNNHKFICKGTLYAIYQYTKSKRNDFDDFHAINFGLRCNLSYELPRNYFFETKFLSVSRRGYNYSSMNDNEFLWSVSLKKSFNNSWSVKCDAFDILNQRKNVYNFVNAQGSTEYITNNMRRYFMLHVLWNISGTGRK